MSHRIRMRVAGIAALAVIAAQGGQSARAEERTADPVSRTLAGTFGKAVESRTLASQRGGTDTGPFSDMKLNGTVSDNRASNLVTGNNVISDGAFAGVSGVPLVVQNSGNNVLIQSATIINVQMK